MIDRIDFGKNAEATRLPVPTINWKLIAFWVLLWWFIYSAPTEGTIAQFLTTNSTTQADTF